MTKILHYIGGVSFGGSQSFVMELYRKMDRSQLQFDFVVFPNEAGGIEDEIKTLGGKIFVCPRYSGKNHFEFCKWWKDFLRDHPEYHVVHGHVRSCASIYLAIAKKAGLVTIAHGHSTSNGRGVSAVFKAILQLPIRHIAHHLFSCSDMECPISSSAVSISFLNKIAFLEYSTFSITLVDSTPESDTNVNL